MAERLKRGSKLQTGYRISPEIEREMDRMIMAGEFVSRADIITRALHFWMDMRHFDVGAAMAEFLQTEEGRKVLRDAVRAKKKL